MLSRTRSNAGVLWIQSHSQSQQLWLSSPCLTFSPLRAWAGFLSWFRLCSALGQERSWSMLRSGQLKHWKRLGHGGTPEHGPPDRGKTHRATFLVRWILFQELLWQLKLENIIISTFILTFAEERTKFTQQFSVDDSKRVIQQITCITSLSGCFAHCVYVWGYFWRSEQCMETRPLCRSSSGWGRNM